MGQGEGRVRAGKGVVKRKGRRVRTEEERRGETVGGRSKGSGRKEVRGGTGWDGAGDGRGVMVQGRVGQAKSTR